MRFYVMDCIACPYTGTIFSYLISQESMSILMWSIDHRVLKVGEYIDIENYFDMVLLKDKKLDVILIRCVKPAIWKVIYKTAYCSGDSNKVKKICTRETCYFKSCPYGINV